MNYVDVIQYTSLTITLLAMLSAAYQDVRTREVSDKHWGLIGSIGILCNFICAESEGMNWAPVIMAISSFSMLGAILWIKEKVDILLGAFSLFIVGILIAINSGSDVWVFAISIFMCPVFLLFYWTGIIRGGADVKCLMVLGISIPSYPQIGLNMFSDVPELVQIMFAPSVSVLFLASVISVMGCSAYCFVRNRGQEIAGKYRGFMMPLVQVEGAFVWPAENIVDGKRTRCGLPEDSEVSEICEKYRNEGIEKIYVTPMVPFILPITVALIFILAVGNPLFIL